MEKSLNKNRLLSVGIYFLINGDWMPVPKTSFVIHLPLKPTKISSEILIFSQNVQALDTGTVILIPQIRCYLIIANSVAQKGAVLIWEFLLSARFCINHGNNPQYFPYIFKQEVLEKFIKSLNVVLRLPCEHMDAAQ